MWPCSMSRWMVLRETAGNWARRKASSRSAGREVSTVMVSVRSNIGRNDLSANGANCRESTLVRRLAGFFLRRFLFPVHQKDQADPDADGAVGDVEGGESPLPAIGGIVEKIDEVHDVLAARQKAVEEVAEDAAEDEAECEASK